MTSNSRFPGLTTETFDLADVGVSVAGAELGFITNSKNVSFPEQG